MNENGLFNMNDLMFSVESGHEGHASERHFQRDASQSFNLQHQICTFTEKTFRSQRCLSLRSEVSESAHQCCFVSYRWDFCPDWQRWSIVLCCEVFIDTAQSRLLCSRWQCWQSAGLSEIIVHHSIFLVLNKLYDTCKIIRYYSKYN